mmetsp:Transcript_59944/g.130288  ORF Transcript_59944/g.130288 Transcript_59944/m.130288 type:complete len:225 (-) Transcript_59944:45-719(-)
MSQLPDSASTRPATAMEECQLEFGSKLIEERLLHLLPVIHPASVPSRLRLGIASCHSFGYFLTHCELPQFPFLVSRRRYLLCRIVSCVLLRISHHNMIENRPRCDLPEVEAHMSDVSNMVERRVRFVLGVGELRCQPLALEVGVGHQHWGPLVDSGVLNCWRLPRSVDRVIPSLGFLGVGIRNSNRAVVESCWFRVVVVVVNELLVIPLGWFRHTRVIDCLGSE